jgi:hypothetical protein
MPRSFSTASAQVIDAISQRDDLVVKLGLTRFLDPSVKVANVRHEPHYVLTVNLQDQAQHAMG